LCLALAGEDGSDLLRLPVMEQEHLTFLPAAPRQAMQPGSAAWRCWTSHRRLLWCSQDGETPGFDDWAALAASNPSYRALLTVPLATAPGERETFGATTFVLAGAPSAADEETLQEFAESLAGSIAHISKHGWEVS
jgi:GAF domain-containing protein